MRCGARSPRSRTVARDRSSSRSRKTCSMKSCRPRSPISRRLAFARDLTRTRRRGRARAGGGQRPVIYAGQGVHYAQAWPQLRALAELLEAPVTTSLQGKSAFPEHHPLALGSGGRAIPKPVHHFLTRADVIFGIGCSFAATTYGVAIPPARRSSTPRSIRPTSITPCRSTTRSPGMRHSRLMPCLARSRSGSVAPPGDAPKP